MLGALGIYIETEYIKEYSFNTEYLPCPIEINDVDILFVCLFLNKLSETMLIKICFAFVSRIDIIILVYDTDARENNAKDTIAHTHDNNHNGVQAKPAASQEL